MSKTKTVLYIEDNPDNMRLIKHVIERQGFTFIPAESGLKGVELANKYDPALILLDIQLPDIDGYEVLEQLRATNPETPIIIITALVIQFDHQRAAAFGCNRILTKPIRVKDLVDAVKLLI